MHGLTLTRFFKGDTMKDTLFDILTAVLLGLVLCGFALSYFDVLTY
jgi:hypothetical protein